MIYTNLLYFLTAIFLFSMATIPAKAGLPGLAAFFAFMLVAGIFDKYVSFAYRRAGSGTAAYFQAEKHASIAALLVYGFMVFGLDLKYYLSFLSFGSSFPALVNIAGLLVFLLLFCIIWRRARRSYELDFARKYQPSVFVFSNIKANLPIVIPWMVLSLCYDLVYLIDLPWLEGIISSAWGDLLFLGIFLVFVMTVFPPLVRRLWGCKKLPPGPLRDHLESFCARQNFNAEILIWPLFEGRVITAGIMGIVPGLRYLLITPALVETMTRAELDSVMAHEIGHVKRFHLLLYIFLIGGFVIAGSLLGEPIYYWFFSRDFFYAIVAMTGFSPEVLRNITVAVPALAFLLFFFRYVFGYFMRNFERQADLHVFPVLGNGEAIISAFEKIAVLSGNIRDQPSWHHFGLGQRVDFLRKCEQDPGEIRRHHRKVGLSLFLYVAFIAAAFLTVNSISYDEAIARYEEKYIRADLLYDANQEEEPALWLFFAGNFLLEHSYERRAKKAFELALEIKPNQPDFLNNLAWLLLTSKDVSLRQPQRALKLAEKAVQLKPAGYILDTLATAWWANGFPAEAIALEEQAIMIDPEQKQYYQEQIERFANSTYAEELETVLSEELPAQIEIEVTGEGKA